MVMKTTLKMDTDGTRAEKITETMTGGGVLQTYTMALRLTMASAGVADGGATVTETQIKTVVQRVTGKLDPMIVVVATASLAILSPLLPGRSVDEIAEFRPLLKRPSIFPHALISQAGKWTSVEKILSPTRSKTCSVARGSPVGYSNA